MKVYIRQIRPGGIERDESFPVEAIGQARQDEARFLLPLQVKARITRAGDEVLAKITAASRYESCCCRCLEEVKRDWTADFTLAFDVEKTTEFIEMDEDIRQEIVLSLPAHILCKEDCRGLCVDCGVNLNSQDCTHRHAVVSGNG